MFCIGTPSLFYKNSYKLHSYERYALLDSTSLLCIVMEWKQLLLTSGPLLLIQIKHDPRMVK